MKLSEDQLRVQDLLRETITLLCKNGLNYKARFTVDALIGVTLDDSEVFLVNLKETVRSGNNPESGSETETEQSNEEARKIGAGHRSRKRPPDQSKGADASPKKRSRSDHDDEDDYADDDDDAGFDDASNVSSIHPDTNARIKQEPGDDNDLVFVKEEQSDMLTSTPGNAMSFTAVPGAQPHPMSVFGHPPDPNLDTSQDGSWTQNQNSSANFDPANLANTSQSTSQGGSNQFVCPYCCQMFLRKQSFKYHLSGVHKVGKPMTCEICGRHDFKAYSSYTSHKRKCKSGGGIDAQSME